MEKQTKVFIQEDFISHVRKTLNSLTDLQILQFVKIYEISGHVEFSLLIEADYSISAVEHELFKKQNVKINL